MSDVHEEPGPYFQPLIATLVTGAARLMLAMLETQATASGLSWAFCDTDSMALTKPDAMDESDFSTVVAALTDWFQQLTPYDRDARLLKIEDVNYSLVDDTRPEALYCIAISAKRYALFNADGLGGPILRKVSAHGLGHLTAPYPEAESPDRIPKPAVSLGQLGVARWHYDLWYLIVEAALADGSGHPDLDEVTGLSKVATSQYSATTPGLLRWFGKHNQSRRYRDQVRPFGFLYAFQDLRTRGRPTHAVAPYDRDPTVAARQAVDRISGDAVPVSALQTYRRALAQYHLHPEYKFLGGDYTEKGILQRRHILAVGFEEIGKESNRWEEQFYLGAAPDAQVQMGLTVNDEARAQAFLQSVARAVGQGVLAAEAQVSERCLRDILHGARRPRRGTRRKLLLGATRLVQQSPLETTDSLYIGPLALLCRRVVASRG